MAPDRGSVSGVEAVDGVATLAVSSGKKTVAYNGARGKSGPNLCLPFDGAANIFEGSRWQGFGGDTAAVRSPPLGPVPGPCRKSQGTKAGGPLRGAGIGMERNTWEPLSGPSCQSRAQTSLLNMWTPDHLRAMAGSSLNPGRTTLVGPITCEPRRGESGSRVVLPRGLQLRFPLPGIRLPQADPRFPLLQTQDGYRHTNRGPFRRSA